ncbi:MAG: SDR family oxidoreductase [Bryobacteraceae bacterium]|nr:SDR family oxidoreductase [Bryobacteraceae bacterium]
MQTIAVTGATGYIGGRLVPRLLEAGFRVRCLVRSPMKLRDRPWSNHPQVEIVAADLGNEDAVRRALQGCRAACYLVHSMISAGRDYAAQDRSLARTFAAAARQAGVARILYLGGLGETGPGLSEHLSSRREVEAALQSAGVPVTVFRAAMIIGSGSASFEILRYLVERLPLMITPRWVHTPCQPIAVRNVIHYLAAALDNSDTAGQTYDIGGPEVLTYRQIMDQMGEELGVGRRLILPVPVLTPRLSSYWIHLVTPLHHSIARPLAEGLRNPVVCRETRIRQLIPQPLLTVREAIRAALQKSDSGETETTWSMAGPLPGDPDWAGGKVFVDSRSAIVRAPAQEVFRTVCRQGGRNGWYANWLWQVRGFLDRLAGGPGLRRGRRNPDDIGLGEALDFWRVTGLEPPRLLRLRAEMKLPGEALLEFRIQALSPDSCRLVQEARFHPRGLLGLLYWFAVTPFHAFVFQGMLNALRREAEQASLSRSSSTPLPGSPARRTPYRGA